MVLSTFVGLFFDHQALDCCVAVPSFKRQLRIISSQRYVLSEKPGTSTDENLRSLLQEVSRGLRQPPDMLCAVLPPWETATIRLVLPRAAREYLKRSIGYEIEKHLPWTIDEVLFAIDSVCELPDERLSVLCTALPKSRCHFYYEILTDAGLAPSFFLSLPYVLARSTSSTIPARGAASFVCIKALNGGTVFNCVKDGMPTYFYFLDSGNGWENVRGTVNEEFSLFLDQAAVEDNLRILVPLELEGWAKENALGTFGEVTPCSDSAFDLAAGGIEAAAMEIPPEEANLLSPERKHPRNKKPLLLAASLGVTALVLLLAYLYSGIYGKTLELERLELSISQKKRLAQQITLLKEENLKMSEQIRDLQSLLPPVSFLETLQALTGSIAPPSWISELSWGDKEITLSGFSPSAADLLLGLEKGSVLREVSFISPTQKAGELEQFRIKGKLIENRPQISE